MAIMTSFYSPMQIMLRSAQASQFACNSAACVSAVKANYATLSAVIAVQAVPANQAGQPPLQARNCCPDHSGELLCDRGRA